MRKCTYLLGSVLGAASLALALALTGCGQSATEEPVAEEAVEAEAEATEDEAVVELEIPEELGAITKAPGALLGEEGELETTDLAELPESDEESVVEDKGEIEEDDGDASKAPTSAVGAHYGGMSFFMPTSWTGQQVGSDYILMSSDGAVVGCIQFTKIKSGASYDVSSMAAAIPNQLQRDGYTDIEVIDYGVGTSKNSGKVVDSYILVTFNSKGTRCVAYFEYLQSKSYMNYLGMSGEIQGWNKNAEDIATIANSVGFAYGEAI